MSDNAPQSAPQAVQPKQTPGLAIASLVLGILSMMGASILLIPTILAIVFGHLSYSRIKKNPNLEGSGLALAGMILGYVSIVFGLFTFGLLAAMAIPAFSKVRDEASRKAMMNDARQIAAAAQQVMMEKDLKEVSFHIDPATGKMEGPLSPYVSKVMKGTTEVDGTFDDAADGFSLRNPHVNHGDEVQFDSEGKPLVPIPRSDSR